MKQKSTSFIISIILALLCFSTLTFAQGSGIVSGRVIDAETGDYLPGSNLMLVGTTIGASSDREGNYRIVNAPPGTYTLKVRYMGYQEHTEEVTVVADRNTLINIGLTVSYVEIEDVVVSGLRQGQVKALAVQKEANTIKNVVSREQMENFPDVNTAEVLQRVPGVHITRSQGDGRYVLIRGTSPRLSTVTVNGEALASTRNEERYSQLDIVGSNQMNMIEVVKAITPDMDANSIGGTVNIITKSAFDFPDKHLDVTVGTGYAELDKAVNYQGKFNYSDKFGADKNFGFSLTGNYDRKNRGADNFEYEYDNEEDINDNEIPFALVDYQYRDYQLVKERFGFGGGLEYRFDPNNKLFVNGMWNKFVDNTTSAKRRSRVSKGDYLNPEGTLISETRWITESTGRQENLIQTHFTFGGENLLANNKLDYLFSYSYGEENHPDQMDVEFELDEDLDMSLDLSDPEVIRWEILSEEHGYESTAANYEFDNIDWRQTLSTNTNITGAVNFTMPYTLFGNSANAKFGTKYTVLTKDRDDNRFTYEWEGDDDLYLSDFQSDRLRTDFFNDNYEFGEEGDWDNIKDFFLENKDKETGFIGEANLEDSKGASYVVDENVFAYYAMTDINFGDLNVLGGVRHEFTNNKLKGHALVFDSDGDFSSLEPIEQDRDYNKFFPMLHFKYAATEMTNVRLAATSTMSRPNYWDMAAHVTVDHRKERIRAGNPDLVPTTALNFDLMGEHYFRGVGIVSGGVFYKDLTDIIFESTTDLEEGEFVGYELEQSVNGGDATLYGIELNWQQELTFLPGFLSGFGIYTNYTHTWSEADLLGREGIIPGQSGDVGNIALGYEAGPFMARLSYVYQGKYIDEVGKDEDHDEWKRAHAQLDFTAMYEMIDNLKLFVEVVNMTNEAKYAYMGIESRPIKIEYYSWWSRIGLKYSL